MFDSDRSKEQERDLAVVDAVVRGGGESRPEDAALVDFALLVRSARPLPGHGAQLRLDARFASAAAVAPRRRSSRIQPAIAFACLVLIVGAVVALDRLSDQSASDRPVAAQTEGETRSPGAAAGLAAPTVPDPANDLSKLAESPTAQSFVAGPQEMSKSLDRKQVKAAQISVAIPPKQFQESADRVGQIASAAGGYVENSNVNTKGTRSGSATFLLMVPVEKYRAVMSELAGLGHIRSQAEDMRDVTAQYEQTTKSLAAKQARIAELERELAQATDPARIAQLKRLIARTKFGRRQQLRQFRSLKNQIAFVPINVTLKSERSAEAADKGSIERAVDRAQKILVGLAATLIVLLAIMLPLALVLAAGWWVARRIARRRASAVLDQAAAQPE